MLSKDQRINWDVKQCDPGEIMISASVDTRAVLVESVVFIRKCDFACFVKCSLLSCCWLRHLHQMWAVEWWWPRDEQCVTRCLTLSPRDHWPHLVLCIRLMSIITLVIISLHLNQSSAGHLLWEQVEWPQTWSHCWWSAPFIVSVSGQHWSAVWNLLSIPGTSVHHSTPVWCSF